MQPYVALGKRLRAEGVDVRVATAPYFKDLVLGAGLEFFPVSIDLQQVLSDVLEKQRSDPVSQALGIRKHVWPLLETNVEEFCEAGQGADFLFQTPATFIAYYVAKYLGIPSVSAEMQPAMHSTGRFRSAILPPLPKIASSRLSAICNRLSYVLVHEVFWNAFRGPVNDVITRRLGMPPAHALPVYTEDDRTMRDAGALALCGWSPYVLPKPSDWHDNIHVTGYWFLDAREDWQPPEGLTDFLESGTKPVAIGFGSTTNLDAEWVLENIVGALELTGSRAVLLTGWSDISSTYMPDEIFTLEQAPHDWLYPRVSATVHHGGSATVGASLRAGVPTITIPFWFDQHFWGERVAALGAGPAPIPAPRLCARSLAEAICAATTNGDMKFRAQELGRAIRQEDGASVAVSALENHRMLR